MNGPMDRKISSTWVSVPACVKTRGGGEMKDSSSITAARRRSDCLCPGTEKAGKKKEAYQRKTQHVSLRQNDIGNETGESAKPDGMVHAAFQISADMQSVNIQSGGCNIGFRPVCLPLSRNIAAFCSCGSLGDREKSECDSKEKTSRCGPESLNVSLARWEALIGPSHVPSCSRPFKREVENWRILCLVKQSERKV